MNLTQMTHEYALILYDRYWKDKDYHAQINQRARDVSQSSEWIIAQDAHRMALAVKKACHIEEHGRGWGGG